MSSVQLSPCFNNVKSVVLFEDDIGASTNIKLKDNKKNYQFIEIIYSLNEWGIKSTGLMSVDKTDKIILDGFGLAYPRTDLIQFVTASASINEDNLSVNDVYVANSPIKSTSTSFNSWNKSSNGAEIKILKVIGFKE